MFGVHIQQEEEKQSVGYLLDNIENILLDGPRLILDHVFKLVGFDAIEDDILKHLVTARLCQPSSKAGTVDYLKSYFDEDIELHKIYRYPIFASSSRFETPVSASVLPPTTSIRSWNAF